MRRPGFTKRIIWALVVASIAAGLQHPAPAYAQKQNVIGQEVLDLVRVNPEETVRLATDWINSTGLPSAVENTSWALFLVLFALQVIRGTAMGSGMAIQQALVRMLIGGTMLSMAPTINGWVRDGFMAFYGAGSTIWNNIVQPGLLAALTEYGGRVATTMAVVTGVAWLGETTIGDVAGIDALGNTLMQLFTSSVRITLFLLGAVLALYMVLQFAAGLLIYLAQVFTPLAAAGLAHPNTEDWFGRWLRHVVHAMLLVLLANVLFGLAIQVGFVGPIQKQNEALKNVLGQLTSGNPAVLKSVFTTAVISLLLPVTVIVGLVFGVLTMWQAETRVAAFLGAVAAGIPMWLPFLRFMGSGGKGGSAAGTGGPSGGGGGGGTPSPSGGSGGGGGTPETTPPQYPGSAGWLTMPERAEMPSSGGIRWQGQGGGERGWFTQPERADMLLEPLPAPRVRMAGESGWLSPSERNEI